MPFLENVLRGKNVPRARMLEVAEHYHRFGGVSPINDQNRALLSAVGEAFSARRIDLPLFWGNRNWHPLLTDTLQEMADRGVRRALAFFTSAFSSYSGCRQYREDIERARQSVKGRASQIDKLRVFFNHPGFIETMVDRISDATAGHRGVDRYRTLFTAHSIPLDMADRCEYVKQLEAASSLVAAHAGLSEWRLVYQSRSGPPHQPWLEPDVIDVIDQIDDWKAGDHLLIVPIGFISDHMEVVFDLDTEADEACRRRAIPMTRVATAGRHPRFVEMICQLVEERCRDVDVRLALGDLPPSHDICPDDCCRYQPRSRPGGPLMP